MSPIIRYIIAFLIFGHGFVYFAFGIRVPGEVREWKGSSWLLQGRVAGNSLKKLVSVLDISAGIVIMLCGIAILLEPLIPGWWRITAIFGALLGTAAFVAFWDGHQQNMVEEGIIGVGINVALLAGALVL